MKQKNEELDLLVAFFRDRQRIVRQLDHCLMILNFIILLLLLGLILFIAIYALGYCNFETWAVFMIFSAVSLSFNILYEPLLRLSESRSAVLITLHTYAMRSCLFLEAKKQSFPSLDNQQCRDFISSIDQELIIYKKMIAYCERKLSNRLRRFLLQ